MSVEASVGAVPPTSRGPLFVVINRGSGANDGDALSDLLQQVFTQAERPFHFLPVSDPGSLRLRAQEGVERAQAEQGVIVAVGGDGTINTVAHAALGAGVPFGVIPVGTFNYFGRTHGLSEDIFQAAWDVVEGQIKLVQVGQVNERIFLVNASLGLYPQLLEDREQAKQQFGRHRLVAFLSAFQTLLRQHRVLRLWLQRNDGPEQEQAPLATPTLFVGNNALQLQQIGVEEAECVHHGQLAAVALHAVTPLSLLGLALRGSVGRLGDAERVISFPFRSLDVYACAPSRRDHRHTRREPRIKVAVDGEVSWMRLPLRFAVCAQRLPLLVPCARASAGHGDEDAAVIAAAG